MSSIAVFRTSLKSVRKRKNRKDATGDNFFKQKECCSTAGVKDECMWNLFEILLIRNIISWKHVCLRKVNKN